MTYKEVMRRVTELCDTSNAPMHMYGERMNEAHKIITEFLGVDAEAVCIPIDDETLWAGTKPEPTETVGCQHKPTGEETTCQT